VKKLKRIVSVSLGSSKRDHRVETHFFGEEVTIERIGTDGNYQKVVTLLKSMDGKVDAFGMGGIDLYLFAGQKRYQIKDAVHIARVPKITPIVDGSGLKNTLERRVISFLKNDLELELKGKKVLMVAGVDRFGMAEAFIEAGCQMTFGDFMFGLGLPIPLNSLTSLRRVARALLPIVVRLPYTFLYPTGSKQDRITPKYARFYENADIIAGDFLFIKKYMPPKLDGKVIVTNTVTAADVEELRQRGVTTLVTSTPEFSGRSFGTNVMEALLVSFSGKKPDELQTMDYLQLLDQLNFKPRVVTLN
jgi:hypothetical protein